MAYPDNILDSPPPEQIPREGVFLLPVCTNWENFKIMLEALDNFWHIDKRIEVIKDLLNAQLNIGKPVICGDDEQERPQVRQGDDCIEWLNPLTGKWECILDIERVNDTSECGDCGCDDDDCNDCDCDDNCDDC